MKISKRNPPKLLFKKAFQKNLFAFRPKRNHYLVLSNRKNFICSQPETLNDLSLKYKKLEKDYIIENTKTLALLHEEYKKQNKIEFLLWLNKYYIVPFNLMLTKLKDKRYHLIFIRTYVVLKYPVKAKFTLKENELALQKRLLLIIDTDLQIQHYFTTNRRLRDHYFFQWFYQNVISNLLKISFSIYVYDSFLPRMYEIVVNFVFPMVPFSIFFTQTRFRIFVGTVLASWLIYCLIKTTPEIKSNKTFFICHSLYLVSVCFFMGYLLLFQRRYFIFFQLLIYSFNFTKIQEGEPLKNA